MSGQMPLSFWRQEGLLGAQANEGHESHRPPSSSPDLGAPGPPQSELPTLHPQAWEPSHFQTHQLSPLGLDMLFPGPETPPTPLLAHSNPV